MSGDFVLPILDLKKVREILNARLENQTITKAAQIPHFSKLDNLEKIAKIIADSIKNGEKIALVGDYDVDGITSCAILQDFFCALNYPLKVLIPNRFKDGYGLSVRLVERSNADLIITADNGINAIEAAEFCKQKGIKLVITDHHMPQESLPDAPICDPKLSENFPQSDICGATVAWYLCAALKDRLNFSYDLKDLLDLLCLAIISDVMPLVDLNRVLFKMGLNRLQNTRRASLIALKEHFKQELNAQTIGYFYAPLLNCAGRIADAMQAYEFLIESDLKIARVRLRELLELNKKRKELQNDNYQSAKAQFLAQISDNTQNRFNENSIESIESKIAAAKFIFVGDESWHEGIIGISAARLCDEFSLPSIVYCSKDIESNQFENNEENAILRGSMRTKSNQNCMEILEQLKDHLLGFGGHAGAAGISFLRSEIPFLKAKLNEILSTDSMQKAEEIKSQNNINIIDLAQGEVLGELPLKHITKDLFECIDFFEPFGNKNPLPLFYSRANVLAVRHFGAQHTKLILCDCVNFSNNINNKKVEALLFLKTLPQNLTNSQIGIIYSLSQDRYTKNVILKIEKFWEI